MSSNQHVSLAPHELDIVAMALRDHKERTLKADRDVKTDVAIRFYVHHINKALDKVDPTWRRRNK